MKAVSALPALLLVLAAALLRIDRTQWCVLVLCITIVLTAEMFNSALEHLARAVDRSRECRPKTPPRRAHR